MKRYSKEAIHILEFILGILFVQCGLPLLDSITAVLMTALEAAKGYFGQYVAKYNTTIADIMNPEDGTPKHAIGFAIPEEEECEDDEVL